LNNSYEISWRKFLIFFLFTCIFINLRNFYQKRTFCLKYKILKFTLNTFLQSLLHVPVRTDNHQGVYTEPGQS